MHRSTFLPSWGAENDGHENVGREIDGPICWEFAGRVIARHENPIFIKFVMDVQHMRCHLTFESSRSKFKVKTAVMKIFRLQ